MRYESINYAFKNLTAYLIISYKLKLHKILKDYVQFYTDKTTYSKIYFITIFRNHDNASFLQQFKKKHE